MKRAAALDPSGNIADFHPRAERLAAGTALRGRGDVVGSFNSAQLLFFAANLNWKF